MTRYLLVVLCVAIVAGCQGEQTPAPAATETTQTAFNEAGAPTIRIEVPEIHCESCVKQVTDALASQAGVTDVMVSLESKIATVAIDKEQFDASDAIATLVDYQFATSKVMDGDSEADEPPSE